MFVAIGNLIYRKGFDVLINSFKRANLVEKGCELVIIGDGPERENLQKQTELLGVSECVRMVGRKTKEEIINYLQMGNAFVLSSRAETFGVVCIEALSQGLPTIATTCGGPEEFIDEHNGVLIPTEDVNALTEAMIETYNNYNKYNQKEIADNCKNKFSPQVIAEQLTKIFEEVVK